MSRNNPSVAPDPVDSIAGSEAQQEQAPTQPAETVAPASMSGQKRFKVSNYHILDQAINQMDAILYENEHGLNMEQMLDVQERLHQMYLDLREVTDNSTDVTSKAFGAAVGVMSGFTHLGSTLSKWARRRQSRFIIGEEMDEEQQGDTESRRTIYIEVLDELSQKIPYLSAEALMAIKRYAEEILTRINRQLGGR